ncbi:T9SS type A sorting domain-containing protein [Aquimarina addita]
MKKIVLLTILLTNYINAQCTDNVNIPDVNFKSYLVNNLSINTNNDTEISCGEAIAFTGVMDVSDAMITDLTGVEAFVNIVELDCSDNQITSLDISANTVLRNLDCSFNQLTSLDVSTNSALLNLSCSFNQISNLDISNNTDLQDLFCSLNKLTNLDVSNNNNLKSLSCGSNDLESLDVSANTALIDLNCANSLISDLNVLGVTSLETLRCTNSKLESLDISTNTSLIELYCDTNELVNIDVSTNTALEIFNCANNQIQSIDVSTNSELFLFRCNNNQVQSIDVSANSELIILNCSDNELTNLNIANGNNTNLSTVFSNFTSNNSLVCIQVDDTDYSDTNWSALKDVIASYQVDCNSLSTNDFTLKDFMVYPNPIKDNVTVQLNEEPEEVSIYTLSGKKVLSTSQKEITISNLQTGLYVIKVRTNNGNIMEKRIIKQ